jgi:ABC-type antimicrobial peptide transport system permease subunit
VIGTSAPDSTVWPAVRHVVADVAPTLAMFNMMSVEEGIRAELGEDLLIAQFAPVFAGLAVVIAMAGFYGILARTAIERRRELGIRSALGATPSNVAVLIAREALGAMAVGLVIGTTLSLWLSRFLESRLYGISHLDAVSFAGAVVVVTIGMLISAMPAWWRVARLSPAVALRE